MIELLRAAETARLQVKVEDEGKLWETGSESVLRNELERYDRLVAACAGTLKDAVGEGELVHGAIFDDPRFERLEAEGSVEFAEQLNQLWRG